MINDLLNFINEQKEYFRNTDKNLRNEPSLIPHILSQTQIDENCKQIANDIDECIKFHNEINCNALIHSSETKNNEMRHFGAFRLQQCSNLPVFKFGYTVIFKNKWWNPTIINLVSREWWLPTTLYHIKYNGIILQIETSHMAYKKPYGT